MVFEANANCITMQTGFTMEFVASVNCIMMATDDSGEPLCGL
jgi:hypothetical protein